MNDFIKGFQYALSGFSWILRPKIRRFVYIPLIINIVLFSLAIGLLATYAETWVAGWIGEKNDWWRIFRWLYDIIVPVLTFLIYATLIFIAYFLFSAVANVIAAPFNALLSKAVEQRIVGQKVDYLEMPIGKEIWITIKTECVKLLRFLSLAALILLLLFIPVVNVIFPLVWFVFMAYALSIQYVDYPMANHGHFYQQQRQVLSKNRWQRLGFGTAANLMLLIPIINFLAMPVCVCGATVWWKKQLSKTI